MMLLLFLVLVLSMLMSHIVVDHTNLSSFLENIQGFLVWYGCLGWHDMVGMAG